MNLISYEIKEEENIFYINNIEISFFLSFFSKYDLEVIDIYAFHENEIFDNSFIDTRQNNIDVFLPLFDINITVRHLEFKSDGIFRAEVNDGYEYIIYSNDLFIEKLLNFLLKVDSKTTLFSRIKLLAGKYILMENRQIIAIFNTFSDYLGSEHEI